MDEKIVHMQKLLFALDLYSIRFLYLHFALFTLIILFVYFGDIISILVSFLLFIFIFTSKKCGLIDKKCGLVYNKCGLEEIVMDIAKIKELTNQILKNKNSECSYIEYKKSEKQYDKILKTICAYGNNYYCNSVQYIFIGIEEENNKENKAIPVIPIQGIKESQLELVYYKLCSLRSFLHPIVSYDVILNDFEGKHYFIIVVQDQKGGPFAVNEKAEKDKEISLKSGRYIRNDFETRIAKVPEEYELIKKFANYTFDEDINNSATIDDLSIDYIKEYLNKTSNRLINKNLDKLELANALKLIDKNDPNNIRVYNHAVLMFADRPDYFIKNCYVELIVDINGSKQLMESKSFKGPIWKQYFAVTKYIKDNYLNSLTIRKPDEVLNRIVDNYPFTAIEELVANAIVHNDYQNYKNIQIYINEKEINIVNYNDPLPPIEIKDLNERRTFDERNAINPSIREKFKELHIIESYGTGIGEAKRSLEANGSPNLYYKYFKDATITSVVIPINEEYYEIKVGIKPHKNVGIDHKNNIQTTILNSLYSNIIKNKLLIIYSHLSEDIISNSNIQQILKIGESAATKYIKIMKELCILKEVEGQGKSKYKFI